MTVIEISPLSNGAHRNQTGGLSTVPEGWALLPPEVGTPETLENFPFGDITTETVDGVAVVTSWTPGTIPEPEPEPEPTPTLDERVTTLETSSTEMSEALDLILSGVTE